MSKPLTASPRANARGPIAVFDSGLGGLTVVRQIRRRLGRQDVVYLGDSARVPYGIKSPRTIREFALQDAAFLLRFGPRAIVVACNTASAVAMPALRRELARPGLEILGVVEPAAAEAVRMARGRPIGVIGTEATIASRAYQRAIRALDAECRILPAAAPLLVPIVEEGRSEDDPIVLHVLADYLRILQRARPAVLILGCTHYPLLSAAIAKLMGPDTRLLDPGRAVAARLGAHLRRGGVRGAGKSGELRCFSTDNPRRFAVLARRFLGADVKEVAWVGTDELAAAREGAGEK